MSLSSFPKRPRLADHVLARRHVARGREMVVLHDTKTGRLVQLGPREWGLLASADGTRDLEGVVMAASRVFAYARPAALRAFLEQLHAAGLLEDGLPNEPPEADDRASAPCADRPLDPLEGFSLTCDGRGSCCRIYASVLFAPLEAARARAALPGVFDGGARHRNVFTPERGSGPTAGSAVALVDGRCAYLEGDGRCSIHRAAGGDAKPLGCRLFPVGFTDDGEAVRVSVAVECACVFESVDREGGSSLAPLGARSRGDLNASVFVAELPAMVVVTSGAPAAPRSSLVAWSRAVLQASGAMVGGAVRAFWALASAASVFGCDELAARRALTEAGPAIEVSSILPWIEALHRRASRRAREDSAWRGDADLARLATRWIEVASGALLDRGACEDALRAAGDPSGASDLDRARARRENFYLRAIVHGHHLVADDEPLVGSLRDRAVRVLVARSMEHVGADSVGLAADPAARYPLALVEATLRGHGLQMYRGDIEEASEAVGSPQK